MGENSNNDTWTCKPSKFINSLLGLGLSLVLSIAIANPQGGQITAGAASIANSGNTTTIHQATDKVVIDWRTFNIAPSEITRFNQPSASSIALNRVNPNFGSSQIYGTLTANGNVWILNPAGIVFGRGAQVNVGGLLATTAEISNADFMKGNYQFKQNPNFPNGAVINNGSITVRQGGIAALVAPGVENNGIITANLGKVALASGNKYTVDLYGDNLIHFGLDSEIKQPGRYADGTNMKHAVSNSGTIIADGGRVQMTVSAAKNVVDKAINMSGVIEAKGVYQRGGTIVLAGGTNGIVSVTGKINASNTSRATAVAASNTAIQATQTLPKVVSIPILKNAQGKIVAKGASQVATYKKYIAYLQKQQNQKIAQQQSFAKLMQLANADTEQFVGGDVMITGEKVALHDDAVVDVTGTNGGGNIKIGGSYQGQDPTIQNSTATYIGPNANLSASALQSGNGGNIIIWSDGTTQFYGNASSKGGAVSGNGGFVEVSGKGSLDFTGLVDTKAPYGKDGTLLLDPKFLIVQASGGSAYSAGVNNLFTNNPTGTNTITPASLNAAGNIILQANTDVTFNDPISLTGTLSVSAGRSILINANIAANNKTLTFSANDSAAVSANRDAGAGNITMAPGTSIDPGGNADVTLTINPLTGVFTPGSITLYNINRAGVLAITSPNAVTLNGVIGGTASLGGNSTITANTSGGAGNNVTFNSGSSITLNNKTLAINVNSAAGGNGAVILDTTSGSNVISGGQTISIATNTGGNTTGGSITQIGTTNSSLNSGGGNITLAVPTAGTSSIGTLSNKIKTTSAGGTLTLTAGSGGAFVENTGNLTLAAPVLNANSPLTVTSSGTLTLPNAPISTGTGNIDLRSLGGNLNLANTFTTTTGNITLLGSGLLTLDQNVTTSGGTVNLTGTGITQSNGRTVNAASGNITANSGTGTLTLGSSGGFLTSGQIAITANNIALDTSGNPSQIGGTTYSATPPALASSITLQPFTAGTTIGLAGGAGTFNLSANELNLARIFSTNLTIGNNTSGAMTVNAWTPTANTANNGTLSLISGSTLTHAGLLNLTNDNAALVETAAGLLTVNSITTVNKPITLTGTGITQTAATTINPGSGTITANAGTGTLTLNGTSLLLGTGTINLTADNVAFNATSQVGGTGSGAGSAANVSVQPSTAGRTIGVAGGVGSLQLTTTALDRIRATNVRIGNNTAGTITIGTGGVTWTPAGTFATSLLTLDSAAGITQTANAPINLGSRGLILRDSNNVALTNASNVFTNIAASLTGPLQLTSNNALTIANLTDAIGLINGITTTPTSNVTLTSSGTISESGSAFINGALLTTSSVGGTTLNSANTITGFNATNATSGNIALTNTGTLNFTGITQPVGNLTIFNTGALTQSGAITVNGTSSFSAGANTINLTNAGNDFTGAVTLTNTGANAVSVRDANALILAGGTFGGPLSVQSNGALSQTGAITANNTSSFNAGAGSIALTNGVNNFVGDVSLSNTGANNVAITDANAIQFAASSLGTGTLNVNSSGEITQSGAITQAASAGNATFNAGAAAITLTNAANNFTGAVSLNNTGANNVAITDANAIQFALSSLGSGTLNVNSTGAITQSGAITQAAAAAGTATFNAGAAAITLTNTANDFTGAVSLNNTGANNVALTDANAVVLAASNVGSGTLTVNATGANTITQTGAIVQAPSAGAASFTTGAGEINLTNSGNDFTGPITLTNTGANAVSVRDANALILAGGTFGGSLSVQSNGALSQTGAITANSTSSFNAGAGSIALTNGANNFVGDVTLTNSGANNVAITDANAIQFALSSLGSGTLNVNSTGAITQSGAITQAAAAGTATFNAGAAAITLANAANDFTGAVSLNNTGANNVALTDANAVVLAASNVGSGTLTVNATGANTITQTGAIVQAPSAGAASFTTGAGVINLTNSGNDFTGPVTLTNTGANAVSVRDVNALILAGGTFGGPLSVQSNGALTQTGAIIANSTSSFNAGAGSIALTNGANNFVGDVTLTNTGANNVAITDANAMQFALSSLGSGTFNVISSVSTPGDITQSGAITQALGAGTATFDAGTNGNINLTNLANDFNTIAVTNANDASFRDLNDLTIGAATVHGDFSTTVAGNLTTSGLIQTHGGNVLLTTTGAGAININGDIKTSIDQISDGGSITITAANTNDENDIIIINGLLNTDGGNGGRLDLERGAVEINTSPIVGNGDINLDGNGNSQILRNLTFFRSITIRSRVDIIVVGTVRTIGIFSPDITIIADRNNNNEGGILVTGTGSINSAGDLSLQASELASQPGVSIALQPGSSLIAAGALEMLGKNISADINVNGTVQGQSVTVTPFGSGQIQLGANITSNGGNMNLGNLTNNVILNNNVTLATSGGILNIPGAINGLGRTLTVDVGSGTDLSLINAGNQFGTVAMTNANNATLLSANGFDLGSSTINNNLTVTAGGDLTNLSGPLNVANGDTTITTNDNNITLTDLNNDFKNLAIVDGRNVSIYDKNAINLGPTNSLISGDFTLTANGAISQTGALNVNGVDKTTNLAAGAGNNITLTNPSNDFTNLVITSGNNVSITDANAINFGPSTSKISGNFNLNTSGAINQTGAIISSGTATINAGAGIINLGNINNNFASTVFLNNTGNNHVTLNNAATLTLGTSSVGSGTLNLTGSGITQTGALTQETGAGQITLATNTAATNIILNQANNLNSAITFGGDLSFIKDFNLRNINAAATLPTNLAALPNLANLTLLFDNAGITFPTLALNSGGNLNVTTGGAITQTGPLTIPGTANFNAGANAITLTQNNSFSGDVTLTNSGNNNVAVTNVLPLRLAASSVGSGTLNLTGLGVLQTGAITQAASAGAVSINGNAGVINLADANNIFTGPFSLFNSGNNNVTLTNIAPLTLGTSSVGSGTLTLTSGGNINQTGTITQAPGAGLVTLASTVAGSDIDLSLANNFTNGILFGGTLANIQDVNLRNINSNAALPSNLASLSNLRNLTLNFDNAGMIFPTLTLNNSGNLVAVAGGAISQTGAISVPGTASFDAGSNPITLTQNNNFTGAVTLINDGANNVSINNSVELKLASVDVGSGTLSLSGAGISQTGAIIQAANAGDVTINGNSGVINLNDSGNSFTGAIALNNSGNNDITLVNNGPLTIGTSNVGSGTLSLTSAGNMSQTGAISQEPGAGAITLSSTTALSNIDFSTAANNLSGAISFGNPTNIQDFKLRNINSGATIPDLSTLTNLRNLTLQFDNAGLNFPTTTLHNGGNLVAIAGGPISQTGVITVPGTSLFNAGANAINLTENNSFTGGVTLINTGNNNVALVNSGLLTLAASNVGSGTLNLTGVGMMQTGAITQQANAGAVIINAGAGVINLGNAGNNFRGTVSLNNSGANNVNLTNINALTLADSSIGSGTFSLATSGPISQTGTITQAPNADAVTINAGSNTIDLTQANVFTGPVSLFNSGANNVALTNAAVLDLGTSSVGSGTVNITANGPITQSGIFTQANGAGVASFTAGANAITLSQNNFFTGPVSLNNSGANNVSLVNNRALTLGTSSIGSGLFNVTANGAIIQTGALTQEAAAGIATFNASANPITLTQNNNFTGAVSLNNSGNNNVAITNNGLLTLAASNVGSGTLTLNGLGVAQSGAITQAASAGAVTVNAGAASIDLSNAGNTFTGAVSLNNSGANDVDLTNSTALNLGTSSVGSGAFNITAGGTISQTGALNVPGTSTFTVTTPTSDILLASAANNFGATPTFTDNGNIRDFALRNISATAAVPTIPTGLRNLTITFDNNGMTLPGITLTGNLAATAGGNIDQSGALIIAGTSNFTVTAPLTDILLASAANNFSTTPVITNNGNVRDLALRNVSATAVVPALPDGLRNLTLTFDNTGMTLPGMSLSGNLTATAGGVINQSGPIIVNNTGAVTTLSSGSGNNINLSDASNNFRSLSILSGNDVTITDTGTTNLAASTISGDFNLTVNGPVIQSGALTVDGITNLIGDGSNNIILTNPNNDFTTVTITNANNTSLSDIDDVILGTSNLNGNLIVNANNNITQSGALLVNGTGRTATFTSVLGDILLNNASNDFTNLAVNGDNVSITDANTLNLAASNISGDFTVNTTGDLTQSGGIIANGVGTTTTLNSGSTGDITLDNINNDFNKISIVDARDVSLNDDNDLELGSIVSQSLLAKAGGDLTTTDGELINTKGGDVTLQTTGAGIITVGTAGIKTSLDQVSPGGNITVTAANLGNLATSVFINGELNTLGGTGGVVTVNGGVALNVATNVGAGDITLSGNSNAQFFGNIDYNTSQTILVPDADIIINGPITTTGSNINLTFFADSNNNGTGGVLVTNTGSILNSGFLVLKGSNLFANPGIAVQVQAGSTITAAGPITIEGNVGSNDILVNSILETTAANQDITINPTGTGQILLGGNLTTNGGAINLSVNPNSNVQLVNNTVLTTAGGAVTANAINGVGQTLTLDVGGATDINFSNPANDFGTVAVTSGNNVQLADTNDIDLGTSNISGDLTVAAGINITDSGPLTVAGTTALTAGGTGSIVLDDPSNDFNIVTAQGNDLTLVDSNAIQLGSFNLTGNSNITANGSITQTVGDTLLINGLNKIATFDANGNNITLNNTGNDFSRITILNGNDVAINDINAIDLRGVIASGNLSVTTNGPMIQSAAILNNGVSSIATFAAGSTNDITLANAANDFNNVIISSGRNVSLRDAATPLIFGTSNISGDLNVISAQSINQNGALTVSGNSSFQAGTSIDLTQANNFLGTVLLNNQGNNNVAVTNTGVLKIGPTTSSLGSGTLTLTGAGIEQTGAITQAPGAGAVTINAGANSIDLASNNDFTGPVSLNNTGANNVQLTDINALVIGTSNIGSGTFGLTAGGTISQTGALTQEANAGLTTFTLTEPNSDILLGSQPNDINGFILIGGDASNLRDVAAWNIGTLNTSLVNLPALTSLRNLTLIFENTGFNAPLDLVLHDGGNLSVDTSGSRTGGIGGDINLGGVFTVPGTTTLIAGNHAITANQNNVFTGEVILTNTGDNNVSINNSIELNIGTSNFGRGTLNLSGVGVSQSGPITQEANAGAVTINAGAGAINLANTGNNFTGSVGLNNTGNNPVQLTNSGALKIGTSNVGSGTLGITAGGTISQTGSINQADNAGLITFTFTAPNSDLLLASHLNNLTGVIDIGGTLSNVRDLAEWNLNTIVAVIDLPSLSNLRNLTFIAENGGLITPSTLQLTLHDGGNLLFDTSGSRTGGTGGDINLGGTFVVPGTTTLIAGNHSIIATGNNTFTGAVNLSNTGNNNVAITNNTALNIGTSSVGSGTLDLTGVGVSQSGPLIQAAGAGAVTINGGAGEINLADTGNNLTGTVSLNNSGANNVTLVNNAPLTMGTSNVGSGTLSLTSAGNINQTGALTQAAGAGTVNLASTVAGSNINLAAAANNFSGPVTFAGTLDNIQDVGLRNINSGAALPTNLTSLNNLRNLTLLFDNAAITFPAFTLHNGGSLVATAGGAISQTGAITVPGTSNFTAGTSIDLSENNNFMDAVSLNNSGNNNVIVNNSGLLRLGTSSVGSGLLTLTGAGIEQTGAITQAPGAGAVTINAGANSIDLASNNDFTGPVSLNNTGANNVQLTDINALVIGTSNIGSGTFGLTAGGNISQTGTITQENNAAPTTFTLTAPNSDILLASQPNYFSGAVSFGGDLSNIRDVARRNISPNAGIITNDVALLTNLRNLTLIFDNAGITIPTVTLHSAGSLYIDTSGSLSGGTGGNITLAGVTTVPGTTTLLAGNHTITANQNNVFTGDVMLSNTGDNNVSINNSVALKIGTSNVGRGTLNLTGVGVSQSGPIIQEADAGAVTVNAGAGAINLANSGNNFTGSVGLNNTGNNPVQLTNSGALSIGTSSVGSSTLGLTAGGTISQTGAITQAPGAGTFTISLTAPNSDILLASQPNNINGTTAFGGTLSNIRDIARRNINSNPGTLLTPLTLLTNLRNVTIILDNSNFFTQAVTLHDGGSLYVDTSGSLSGGTGGNIVQLGPVTVPGSTTLIAGNHSIIANQNNVFMGEVTLSNSGNNNVILNNTVALDLASVNVGSGTLTLSGVGVSQSGPLIQAAGAGAVTINGGAGEINLADTSNNLTGTVSLNNSGANNVTLVNNAPLTMGTSNVGSGTLSLTSAGNINQTGAITQAAGAGTVNLASTVAGSNINLAAAANNFSGPVTFAGTLDNIQDVGLRNINSGAALPTNLTSLNNLRNLTLQFDNAAISFPTLTLHNGGSLVATAGGAISQTGALTVPGSSTFTAGTSINLTQNNNFSGTVSLINSGNNNVSLVNTAPLILGTSSVGSGVLSLTAAGDISQTGAITQDAGAGAINLASTVANSSINLLAANNLYGLITFTGNLANIQNLALRNINSAAALPTNLANLNNLSNLTLQFDNAGMTFPTLTLNNGNLTATAGGVINLSNPITILGSGNLDLTAAGGIILGTNIDTNLGNQNYNSAVTLANAATLSGNDINFNSTLDGAQNLAIDSGTTGNITFNNNVGSVQRLGQLTIVNANNVTNNTLMRVSSFAQLAGSNLTSLGLEGLDSLGNASFTTFNVTGNINTGSLNLNTSFADMFGTVGGDPGLSAAENVVIENTITPDTHFFNGFDLANLEPTPPTPTPTPTPTPIPDTLTVSELVSGERSIYPFNLMNDWENYFEQEACGLNNPKGCLKVEIKTEAYPAPKLKIKNVSWNPSKTSAQAIELR